jgi:c-di-GMP phosphodiesterase
MPQFPTPHWRKLITSFVVAILTAFVCTAAGYLQIKQWLTNQQTIRIQAAIRQVDAVILNAATASRWIFYLAGGDCSSGTLRQMRRVLAITPNVANLELSLNGIIYCTTLAGKAFHPVNENNALYLTSSLEGLAGHPYMVYQYKMDNRAAFASIDGFYLRNILTSTSSVSPVLLVTGEGAMDADGELKAIPVLSGKGAQVIITSVHYPYRFVSYINNQTVLLFIRNNNIPLGILVLIIASLAGTAFYYWQIRARSPRQMLEEGIRKGEFVPYVQPIVDSDSYELKGGEVLMRWLHEGMIIPPDQFIPTAEQSGLIISMTRSLLVILATRLGSGNCSGKRFYLSINISAVYFQSGELVGDFQQLLQALDENIELVIEITEREALTDSHVVTENISALKALGVQFFLDDFGTGYSSLDYLQRMEIDCIKIDKVFTERIGKNIRLENLIDNIVDLARRMELKTVAEGVETKAQANWLKEHGVDSLQGYLFSRPVPLDEFINIYLKSKR